MRIYGLCMTEDLEVGTAGHVFISYVRDDAPQMEALKEYLEAAGVPVWTDTANLGPGDDWKMKIREAITKRALVFIACFSSNSAQRETTFQNAELLLAIEQMQLRTFDQTWLLPVKFDECELPAFSLGGGRTLEDLQTTHLFGDRRELEQAKLLAAVLRALGSAGQIVMPASREQPSSPAQVREETQRPSTVAESLKQMLHEPARQMALEEMLLDEAARTHEQLMSPELFPVNDATISDADRLGAVRAIVNRYKLYDDVVHRVSETLAVGCAWGTADHERIWARVVRTIASTVEKERSGNTILLDLRAYPALQVLYASALGAISRDQYGALRAVTSDAQVKRDGFPSPAIVYCNTYQVCPVEAAGSVLALSDEGPVSDETIQALLTRGGNRYTPISDHLHERLRPLFKRTWPDDDEYSEAFDRVEILLGLIAADARLQAREGGAYVAGPSYGRFTWKSRYLAHADLAPEKQIQAEFETRGPAWTPLRAGLFGGDRDRARAAFELFVPRAGQVRDNRF